MKSEKLKYNGLTFFKKPDGYYRNNKTTLHRYKYEKKYGSTLPYFHLHHRDGNKSNNNFNNLELLTPKEHAEIHKAMRLGKMFENQMKLEMVL